MSRFNFLFLVLLGFSCLEYSCLFADDQVHRIPTNVNPDDIFEHAQDPNLAHDPNHQGSSYGVEQTDGKKERPIYLPDDVAKRINNQHYHWTINNYDIPRDYCFVRGARLVNGIWNELTSMGIDPRGKDELLGTNDDKVFKILIRYPQGQDWSYHIAACYQSENGTRICDPIRGAIEPYTEQGWLKRHGHGLYTQKGDVTQTPPPGVCYYSYQPATRYDLITNFPDMQALSEKMKMDKFRLDQEIYQLRLQGRQAFPNGSVTPW